MENPNKILFMLRLYSGLMDSIKSGKWNPSGVPAIYKLLEEIQQINLPTILFLYCPEENEEVIKNVENIIWLDGLDIPVHIIRPPRFIRFLPRRFRELITQLYLGLLSLRMIRSHKVRTFYTDRGNVIGGGLVARFSRAKVVLRILGMPPEMASLLTSPRLTSILYRWAYKSPFNTVIGTRDGSAIVPFLKDALRQTVPRHIKTNGVENIPTLTKINIRKPVRIGFIGRLNKGKGAEQLIEAAQELLAKDFEVRIVGAGPDLDSLQKQIQSHDMGKKLRLLGAMPHHQLMREILNWDIYVSLNAYGQMSNANLEAYKAGLCLLFVSTLGGDDPNSKDFYGADTVCWIDRENLLVNLVSKLSKLIDCPDDIKNIKKRTRRFGKDLGDWNNRIKWEIDVIRNIHTSIDG